MPDNPAKNQKLTSGTFRLCVHYAISHACTLAIYILYFVLLLTASGLVYIIFRDDLPVPDFLLQRIEDQLANRGIDATFRSAQLDPKGRILVNHLTLAPRRFGEPVFEAEIAMVELDRFQLIAGIPALERLRAENVRIICPAALSPSGVSETVFEIAGLDLRVDGERWRVEHLAAEVGPLHISARGRISIPSSNEQSTPINLEELFDTYAEFVPEMARAHEHLQAATDPRLEIKFDGATNTSITVNALLTASGWQGIPEVEAQDIFVLAEFTYDPDIPSPVDVRAGVNSLTYAGLGSARKLEAVARWDKLPSAENPWPTRLSITGSHLSHPNQDLLAPALTINRIAWPEVELSFQASLEGEPFEISLAADAEKRSGTAWLHGRFGKNWLPRASEILERDVTYYATVTNPPDFSAQIEIDPDLKWKQADFRVTSGPITTRGVALDRARGRGKVTPELVSIHHFEIASGDQHASGTYRDDLRTRGYRLHLVGAMKPLSISPWFSGWWGNFWRDFSFRGTPPEFAVEVHGNWLQPKQYSVLGSALARDGGFRNIEYEAAKAKYFIRPDYYDIYDGSLVRAEGKLEGEMQLAYESGNRIPIRQSFDFESTADLVKLAGIFGEGGDRMLGPYRYTTPPFAKVSGTVTNKDGTIDTDLSINIESDHEFRYHDFPVESISTDVTIRNTHVELPRIRATYAEGDLNASAVVDDGTLTFSATLSDAIFADSLQIFSDFLDRISPPKTEPEPKAATGEGLGAGLVGGRWDVQFSGTGEVEDFQSYTGSGTMRVSEAELAKVKLFGVLADVLDSIGLKVGVLNFHSAESTIEVDHERLIFPDMRITGNTGALEPKGEYNMEKENLDFRARLYPLRESGGTVTQIFGMMLDPLSNFFEVRLTGTLDDPNWTPSLSAIQLIKRLAAGEEKETEGTDSTSVDPNIESDGTEKQIVPDRPESDEPLKPTDKPPSNNSEPAGDPIPEL